MVSAALELLDELGLDALSTRRLAQKLGIESASLYWHFRDKAALLAEMATTMLAAHQALVVPADPSRWSTWFADNARSLRCALLAHRDGARLHAGAPEGSKDPTRSRPKIDYLVRAGMTPGEAGMALFAAHQFTIGCVLDEQAHDQKAGSAPKRESATPKHIDRPGASERVDPEAAFEFGLALMVDGLRHWVVLRSRR
ncbi:TetR/AcrR family transcriptional regulator C-terminal domain-containing protein [Dyella monticola]|uniref:TetR/AcrR family transcriptional regulator C-terminal domain-containing protein n=1 Tax=Dyella monticola TaxID=1927958 RepID=UPI001E567F3B|nr:TetR/AcrR family transcriptional regulator C-terminal domain-containing protein [Dyella monticola]